MIERLEVMKEKIEAATLTVMAGSLYALVALALGSITPGDSFLGIPHKEWPLYRIRATINHHWWWFSGVFLLCCVIANVLEEGLAATLSGLHGAQLAGVAGRPRHPLHRSY
jgi:hypothetical protein